MFVANLLRKRQKNVQDDDSKNNDIGECRNDWGKQLQKSLGNVVIIYGERSVTVALRNFINRIDLNYQKHRAAESHEHNKFDYTACLKINTNKRSITRIKAKNIGKLKLKYTCKN